MKPHGEGLLIRLLKYMNFVARDKIIEVMGAETCPLCLEAPTRPVMSKCGHRFCEFCIYKWLQDDKKPCPLCRAFLVFNKQKGIIRPTFIPTSPHSPSSSEVGMLTGYEREPEYQQSMMYGDDYNIYDMAPSDPLLEHDELGKVENDLEMDKDGHERTRMKMRPETRTRTQTRQRKQMRTRVETRTRV